MMRNTTKKKIAPIVIASAVVLYMVPMVLPALALLGGAARESSGAAAFLSLYALLGGAVIVGIVRALLQRLSEIDSGEEEEASRY